MKKFLLLSLLVLSGFISAEACSCLGGVSVKKALKTADAVFTAQVINAQQITLSGEGGITFQRMVYQLVKTEKYKGRLKSDTFSIITGMGGGDCGFPFEAGKEYTIYAQRIADNASGARFSTNICTRTALASEEESTSLRRYSRWRF